MCCLKRTPFISTGAPSTMICITYLTSVILVFSRNYQLHVPNAPKLSKNQTPSWIKLAV